MTCGVRVTEHKQGLGIVCVYLEFRKIVAWDVGKTQKIPTSAYIVNWY